MALTRASAAVVKTEELVNNRNLLHNGAMQVNQRANTNLTGITSGTNRTVDRWAFLISNAGTWTMNVESSAPSGTEFRNSANLICTTADTSLSTSDYALLNQSHEGLNLQTIKKGTVNAQPVTISFWTKSSNTGTYIVELRDNDNNRMISKSYTINTAHTWEKQVITFPPDTIGQFSNSNQSSFPIFWWLAAGPTYTANTLSTVWGSNSDNSTRAAGQVNLANRVGNYLAFTGAQLEVGSTETPYEWRDYQQELAMCQRYYWKVINGSGQHMPGTAYYYNTTEINMAIQFPVPMRATPTLEQVTGTDFYYFTGVQDLFDGWTAIQLTSPQPNPTQTNLYVLSGVSGTSGRPGGIRTNNASCSVAFNAEL